MSASRRAGAPTLVHARAGLLVVTAALLASLHACEALQGPSFDRRGFSPTLLRQVRRRRLVCEAGKRRLPLKLVNDGYCDCADGSDEPGTGACPEGKFYCDPETQGLTPFTLPASHVGDGHCDCCTGDDEPAGTCANTCHDLARECVSCPRSHPIFRAAMAQGAWVTRSPPAAAQASRPPGSRPRRPARRLGSIRVMEIQCWRRGA